jgi:hypothetical protein
MDDRTPTFVVAVVAGSGMLAIANELRSFRLSNGDVLATSAGARTRLGDDRVGTENRSRPRLVRSRATPTQCRVRGDADAAFWLGIFLGAAVTRKSVRA